jgi:transposase
MGGLAGHLVDWVREYFKIDLEVVKRSELHQFKILPKTWIAERAFSWIDTNRRNSKF